MEESYRDIEQLSRDESKKKINGLYMNVTSMMKHFEFKEKGKTGYNLNFFFFLFL